MKLRSVALGVAVGAIFLGVAYPAVTFAATGSSSPPSTLNTCTKVNPKTHLYGKTKVSATPVCPVGQIAQTWNPPTTAGAYNWNATVNVGTSGLGTDVTGTTVFPAGYTVSFVSGSPDVSGISGNCSSGQGAAGLSVGGTTLVAWDPPGYTPNAQVVTLTAPSAVSASAGCFGALPDPGATSPFTVNFNNVTFSVTPPVKPYS